MESFKCPLFLSRAEPMSISNSDSTTTIVLPLTGNQQPKRKSWRVLDTPQEVIGSTCKHCLVQPVCSPQPIAYNTGGPEYRNFPAIHSQLPEEFLKGKSDEEVRQAVNQLINEFHEP